MVGGTPSIWRASSVMSLTTTSYFGWSHEAVKFSVNITVTVSRPLIHLPAV